MPNAPTYERAGWHMPTTAGYGVPPEIIEVTLVYHHISGDDLELGRVYRSTLPPRGDGIFLVIDREDGMEKPYILKFEINQACHILVDQSHLDAEDDYKRRMVSNQATLYVTPKDDAAHRYINALVLEAYKRRQQQQEEQGSKLSVELTRLMGRA